MTKQEIKIGTRTLPVAFDMTTLLTYEEITDRPFFGEGFERNKERLALIFAAVYAADRNTTFTIDDLMQCDNWQQVSHAFELVTEMAKEFFIVPKVVADAEKQEADTSDDADAKN